MEQDISKRSLSTSSFNENRLFVIKLIIGLALLILYINSLFPQYSQGYNASLIDKVRRLKSLETPKIVLIGNSNVAFGIDSVLLEDEMGMPVVNMGLHGGLGNAFHEEMAKMNVIPGDIYVICHADYNDKNQIANPELAWITIENHFSLWRLLRFSDIKEMMKSFPEYLKKSLTLASFGTGNRDSNSIYARNAFNEYGDICLLRKGKFYEKRDGMRGISPINSLTVERINALNRYLLSKGATLLIAGYPIRNGSITDNYSKYISFQEELSTRLDCPVISNYIDYMFDYRYFYNARLHLNSDGAKLRTIQLVSDIKRWMDSDSGAVVSRDGYVDMASDVNLPHIDDFYEYLDILKDAKDRYTIFISANDEDGVLRDAQIKNKLEMFGLFVNRVDELQSNYVAVLEKGVVITEIMQSGKIEISGAVDNGSLSYLITSDGENKGSGSSILLNGEEYSENTEGVNFVIYSNETHRRLDEVGFDFSSPEPKAHRFVMK